MTLKLEFLLIVAYHEMFFFFSFPSIQKAFLAHGPYKSPTHSLPASALMSCKTQFSELLPILKNKKDAK